MSNPFDTPKGKEALGRIDFYAGMSERSSDCGPNSCAAAIVAMIEWLDQQWDAVGIEKNDCWDITAWRDACGAGINLRGGEGCHADTLAEALVEAVAATPAPEVGSEGEPDA